MVNKNRPSCHLNVLALLLMLPCLATAQTNLTILIANLNINALTSYTYQIAFSDTIPRNQVTLVFPAQVSLAGITTVQFNSVTLNSSVYTVNTVNNSIVFNRSVNTSLIVVVNNVKNPASAISTFNFTISSNNPNDSLSPLIFNMINYTPGSLQSCVYTFSGSTEQTNSTLRTTILLKDPIPAGNSKITIGYPIKWDNSNTKSMTFGGVSIICSYSVNKSAAVTATCGYTAANV